MWLERLEDPGTERKPIEGSTEEILPGVTAIKTGGHFDGSLVLHWEEKLFIADTFITVPVSASTNLELLVLLSPLLMR